MSSRWITRSGAALATITAVGLVAPTATAAPLTSPDLHSPRVAPTAKPMMTYKVQRGDSFYLIAKRTGVSVNDILSANNLKITAIIHPGQQLRIPAPAAKAPAKAAPKAVQKPVAAKPTPQVYVVKRGDTLGAIAKAHKTTVAKLVQDNKISNPNRIYVGMRLTVGATKASTPAAKPAAAPAPSAQKAPVAAATYTVKRGDTLGAIARKHGTTIAELVRLNKLSNPNRLYVGQKLAVKQAATSTPAPSAPSQKRLVENNFPGYTYADSTVDAANKNKATLISKSVPSRAQMQQIVKSTAISMGVDPRLALAHAYVESGFDMTAVSPANAVGVMQVIPSSGQWASQLVGRKLNLLDPHDNAVAGIAIIRHLHRATSNYDHAVGGYYQGLGGVQKYGMRSDTKAYVSKIKNAMNRF